MMLPPSVSLIHIAFYEPPPIRVEVSDAPLTSDAGVLPLRQFDERIGLTNEFAAALHDPRDPNLIVHTYSEMVRSRVFGILAGYEDQNDHDALRTDPVFKLVADRSPEEDGLASQPTLSRFENQINIISLKRLRQVFVEQVLASFELPPLSLAFDLDAVDDPAHGSQQLTLFHAFYEHRYLPLVITRAENDQIVMLSLRHGTAAASLGADDDLEYLVTRRRAVWPNVWDGSAQKLATFTDVRELQRRLKAQGVRLVNEADEGTTGPASFVAVDPDGNPILVDQHV
jgi:hypothetical protein